MADVHRRVEDSQLPEDLKVALLQEDSDRVVNNLVLESLLIQAIKRPAAATSWEDVEEQDLETLLVDLEESLIDNRGSGGSPRKGRTSSIRRPTRASRATPKAS